MKKLTIVALTALCLAALALPAWSAQKLAVVVVDVQGDFTEAMKGSLAVAGTDQAYLDNVKSCTMRMKQAGIPIYATQDWHPADHMSFAANQKGKKPFEAIKLSDGRTQVLWPNHCVQNTEGAAILLEEKVFTAVVTKGSDPNYDSYSGFKDDGGAKTTLDKTLKEAGVETIIVYGIATDYCVKATVMDGLSAGYQVVVVQDLCRGVAPDTSGAAWKHMQEKGAVIWAAFDEAKLKELK